MPADEDKPKIEAPTYQPRQLKALEEKRPQPKAEESSSGANGLTWIAGGVAALSLIASAWFFWQQRQFAQSNLELNQSLQQLAAEKEALTSELLNERLQNGEKIRISEEQLGKLSSLKSELENKLHATELAIQKNDRSHDEMLAQLRNEIANKDVHISELNGGIQVSMDEALLFETGRAQINDKGGEVLGRIAGILAKSTDKIIRVEGHCDNIPIKGSGGRYSSNWQLSCDRAANVVVRLLAQHKLDPTRVEAVGLGEFHPVASNDTAAGRKLNRRIEIKLFPQPRRNAPGSQPGAVGTSPGSTKLSQPAAPELPFDDLPEPEGTPVK
ncbi:MAG: hypothetical protein RL095_4136 [Verrucomicrobiota bacterium]|jgi:chemotaxis protein MotB